MRGSTVEGNPPAPGLPGDRRPLFFSHRQTANLLCPYASAHERRQIAKRRLMRLLTTSTLTNSTPRLVRIVPRLACGTFARLACNELIIFRKILSKSCVRPFKNSADFQWLTPERSTIKSYKNHVLESVLIPVALNVAHFRFFFSSAFSFPREARKKDGQPERLKPVVRLQLNADGSFLNLPVLNLAEKGAERQSLKLSDSSGWLKRLPIGNL